MSKLTDSEKLMIDKLEKIVITKGVSNEFLVQLIELGSTFLNPLSISDYAKQNNMSYNGVKNHRNIVTLLNQKFVI